MSAGKLTLAACLAAALVALPAARAAGSGELLGPGTISTGVQETSVALTRDGNTLYFMRSDVAEADDTIMVSHRADGRWSPPRVAAFSGQWHDSEPTLSPDGRRLYFVSNRPPRPGAAAVSATMNGRSFAGTNLWYVERQAHGGWGAPVHVDGALNDGAMIYNPSVAANGDIYFSAHRADSGKAYQIYVARDHGHAAPERLPLGELAHNRMDPAIDPAGRFLLYAGDEGDALGRADIYIAFRRPDGSWGKPEHLGGEDLVAVVEAAGEQQGLVEELADLGDQGERAPGPGMPAGAGGHCDQPVDPGLSGLFRMAAGGHVVEHQAAIAVHRIDHFAHRPQAGDDDGHAVLHAQRKVRLQARVAVVDDEVHRVGRRLRGVGQAGLDLFQPGLEAAALALVQRREAADDAAVAAGQHQLRVGHQKHGRRHQGQAQTAVEQGGQGHGRLRAGFRKV